MAKIVTPEIAPGVKKCDCCGAKFTLVKSPTHKHIQNWVYRMYCSRKCANVMRGRRERAAMRLKAIKAEAQRPRVPDPGLRPVDVIQHAVTRRKARQLEPLKALPPGSQARSLRHAFWMAAKKHEEFLDVFIAVMRENRGFKSRVRREIQERRHG